MKFLLTPSSPQTIFKFRGNPIKEIQLKGFEVHIAAPFKNINKTDKDLINLKKLNVKTHDISLDRRRSKFI